MQLEESLENVKNKEDFVKFINQLVKDLKSNPQKWANATLEDYLNGIASWVEDMDGIFTDSEDDFSEIDWSFLASILFTGSRYE